MEIKYDFFKNFIKAEGGRVTESPIKKKLTSFFEKIDNFHLRQISGVLDDFSYNIRTLS